MSGNGGGSSGEATARERMTNVFRYLRAFNEHRNPATRELKEQLWSFRLRTVPAHPAVTVAPIGRPGAGNEGDATEVLLRVKRPDLTPPPAPPDVLQEWLQPGWNDATQALEVRETRNELRDGRTLSVRFDAEPQRVRALSEWQPVRSAWATGELPALQAARLFQELYELHGRLDREAEKVELVLGDGILSWQRPDGDVFHPLLVQRVQLQFNPSVPEFTVTDTGSVGDLYTALLRGIADVDGKVLARCRAELSEGGFLPSGGDDTSGFLRRLGVQLSPHLVFREDGPPAQGSEPPAIGRDPVLFLRSRTLGFANAVEGILQDLPNRQELPSSLLRIVGVEEAPTEAAGTPQAASLWSEPEDVLLSKPANPEQVQIAQRLDRHGCVLVQGPPGTGKTHTIANLIGHLLANGKSVLVTSHTTKALKVLRDQVVPALRPLCVSVLENDLESRGQLEGAVTAIADRLSSSNAERLDADAARLTERRQELLQALRRARTELIEAQSDEYRDLVLAGGTWPPSDAARKVAAGEEAHGWIPAPVQPGAALPLTPGEVLDLYATNATVSAETEAELAQPLPEPAELLPPQELESLIQQRRGLEGLEDDHRRDLWSEAMRDPGAGGLEKLAERCARAMDLFGAAEPWKLAIVAAGEASEAERAPWESLLTMIEKVRARAVAARELLLQHAPVPNPEGQTTEHLRAATELRKHLEQGGSINALVLLTHGNWKRLLKGSRVASGEPRSLEHLRALEEYLRLAVDREELRGRWDRQLGVLGAPSSAQLGPVPEEACAQFTGEIRRCLSWAGTVWSPVLSELRSHGLRWQDLLDEQPPNLTPNGALLRLKELVVGPLQRVLRARAVALAKVALDQRIDTEARRLDQWGGAGAASATVRELVRALRQREGAAYASAFARLVELTSRRALLDRRRTLLAKLEPVAHAWASAIRDRRGAHAQEVPPGEPAEAWVWRQLHDELERRGRVNLTELQQNIETKSGELRRITAELIECRAWAGQTRRTTLRQRQALVGWLDTIRKIGKGTGKRAPRLRAEAARKMNECKDAVPVWVMPLAQVVENFDAGMRFDVVIIDEASQSDVMALIALYFARRAVVVGDHEQVSPSAVGEQIEVVGHLIDEHLDGVPNGILYNGTTSVYDLARQSFGGMVCLTEHFRCVPEIIEFSNQLSYDGRIKPLRESGTSKLEPLLTHRVEGHASDKVNTTEAMAVATLLAAALEREEYKDKTFGVISLVGEEQALEIERLLREHLHPAELERRRILCGNAAQFQGDERDVMFLSMVDSPQGGPLTLREQNMFKQRFNVAVSRAKDQLWVVHSLNRETDLKPGDLRRRLLEHCQDPFGLKNALHKAEPLVESVFEKEVYERLTRAGYQATPQWPVGHYRIDLVVDGGGRRVAIECDGDRYHPLEKLQEDMARQAILERLGWRFVRIRGSAFFRNPRKAMDSVFARLSELGVTADRASKSPEATDANTSSLVREALVRRADELQRAWAEREAAVPSEGANGGASTGAPKKKTPFAGRTGWGRAKAGTPSEQAAPPTPPSKSEPEKPTPRVASAPPAAPAPSVAAAAPPPANPAPRASAIATALQASAIPPPKSGDPLPDTVTALLDAKAFSCPSCGGKRRLWVGRDGPLLKCEASACAKSEAVAVPVLSSALRQLGTRCDCGEPFKIVDMSAGRTFIGCSGYPTHRKSFGWLEFREHVKARAAKA